MTRIIDIGELSPAMITRSRGEQAYAHLCAMLHAGEQVELRVFPGKSPISMSFLDGIIVKLVESGRLTDVIFATNDERTMDKLSNIREIRSIPVAARWDGEPHRQGNPADTTVASPRKPRRVEKRVRTRP